jgi:hypothetical protein
VPQDHHSQRLTRRAALQLGASTGAALLTLPYLAGRRDRDRAVRLGDAVPVLSAIPNWPVPAIITRAQWGANEALREPGQIYDTSVSKIIVHHTGTPNTITNYPGLCRSIFTNQVAGEYIDIAYHWLIDPNGNIYEGRWAQDYPAGAPHTGERNGANVRGGHALYHNTRTIGIALMGNYDTVDPPAPMVDALVRLLAWKCARWGLHPLGSSTYTASNGMVRTLSNICGHRDTSATACPGGRMHAMLAPVRARVAAQVLGGGYWIASNRGQVVAVGGVSARGDVTGKPVTGIAAHPANKGYWLCEPNGGVYPFGEARHFGSMRGLYLAAPVISMAPTPTGKGYWLVGGDGGIFAFGDAKFLGSMGATRLAAPVLGMVPTPTGKGYWLYARDGGVFAFGDAKFMGSTGGMKLVAPVVAMAVRPQGDGYWLAAGDGGVFAFGRALFAGSGALSAGAARCVDILPSTSGRGYVLLREDGSVQAFGDAPNLGSAKGRLSGGAIGIVGKITPVE